MIAWLGVSTAYIADAISFCAVIGAVLMMRARPEIPAMVISGFSAALEGLKFLRSSPVLLGVMLTDFFATFFSVRPLSCQSLPMTF